MLSAVAILAWAASARAAPESASTGSIVLSPEELNALGRGKMDAESTETKQTEEPAATTGTVSAYFEACRGFPMWQLVYWEWLETGALGPVAEIEKEIDDCRADYRRVSASARWSEALQRNLDDIEDEIAALESKREQTLLEQIALLEAHGSGSAEQRTRTVLFETALALKDLEAGKAKKAVEMLDRAKERVPDEPLVRALGGIALREAGRDQAAREELEAALAIEPQILMALVALAQVHEDNLEYDRAAEKWDRARQMTPSFPSGAERWADRHREAYPGGVEGLRRSFADRFLLRLRLARLREFARQYYASYEKSGYRLIYDPSIGIPPVEEYIAPLREMVSLYLERGEEGVEPGNVERLFRAMSRERDQDSFGDLMSDIGDFLATAERDVGQALAHSRVRPPVVVLYNPVVWETLIADRSTLGLFAPHGRSISLYLLPRMNPDNLKSTIYHEYTHYVTFEITGPRTLPLWLVEGLAEHVALRSGYDRFARDSVAARWRDIWSKDQIARPWFDKDQQSFDAGDYYKARRAVGVLAARFGDQGLARFLGVLGDGADLDEASRGAFQMGYRDLLRFMVRQLPSWTGP
jgi:tetratricopeptide (TPR) repeat protein